MKSNAFQMNDITTMKEEKKEKENLMQVTLEYSILTIFSVGGVEWERIAYKIKP